MNALASTLSLGTDEDSSLSRLSELRPVVFEAEYTRRLPIGRMTALLNAIGNRLAPRRQSMLFFAGVNGGQRVARLAFEATYTAAMQRKDLVLYLDMAGGAKGMAGRLEQEVPATLDEFVMSGGGKASPFVALRGTRLFYARLRDFGQNIPAPTLEALLDRLRQQFGLIVTCSATALADGSAMTLAKLADGTVLVAEAERTREPVALQLKYAVESQGGKVIGAVLDKRRYPIPNFLYRLLYRGEGRA